MARIWRSDSTLQGPAMTWGVVKAGVALRSTACLISCAPTGLNLPNAIVGRGLHRPPRFAAAPMGLGAPPPSRQMFLVGDILLEHAVCDE